MSRLVHGFRPSMFFFFFFSFLFFAGAASLVHFLFFFSGLDPRSPLSSNLLIASAPSPPTRRRAALPLDDVPPDVFPPFFVFEVLHRQDHRCLSRS